MSERTSGHGFGTLPVFLAAISTILGAIMFLRFGYAVGHTGLLGAFAIIVLGHLVTVPTALAIAEIATNRRVEGGGEYFIISRSFGKTIGAVIGVSLYLSQAVSVAFYLIAFAEAFEPLQAMYGPFDPRLISLPATLGLIGLVLLKGAALGVKALYVVVATLAAALIAFFLGSPIEAAEVAGSPTAVVGDPDPFFVVFAICFPAFTGMTAGVGLSGDLANPRRSIPLGTLSATVFGMLVYFALVWKLYASAPPDMLGSDQLIMAKIALWGPLIPIGLGAATLSSAIGSILIAPRTLQAIGGDGSLPLGRGNSWLARGVGAALEPRNATLVTGAIALVIVFAGNVDFVARLISMFFMVTYGALCAISLLEHFAARPSYRPSFRSRWYISALGAFMCLFMMFQMDPAYALLAIASMVLLYRIIAGQEGATHDIAAMVEAVMSQAGRHMQISLQRRRASLGGEWRPRILMVDQRTFDRRAHLDVLRWLSHRQGFATYLHLIVGRLDAGTMAQARTEKARLLRQSGLAASEIYLDTLVSPSMVSALAQSLQIPGVSGLPNNTVLFEFSVHDPPEVITEVTASCKFTALANQTMLVLRHGDNHFGDRRRIHLWLTWHDDEWNANLMLLFAYVLMGHPEWSGAEISVFAALPEAEVSERQARLLKLVEEGRLPIRPQNIRFLSVNAGEAFHALVGKLSNDADLVIFGFSPFRLEEKGDALFQHHAGLRDVLWVSAGERVEIE